MKQTTPYLLLAASALGFAVLSTKLVAANAATPAPATLPSCCSSPATTATASTNTNGIPDLLKTCPVSGEKLNGDMGAPFVFSYKGQEVKLCCKGCKKDFEKNPDKYLKLIRAADKK